MKKLSSSTIVATAVEECRRYYDKGFTKENSHLSLGYLYTNLSDWGLWLQIVMGLVAMLGVHELLRMKVKYHDT